jgi:phosphopantothenoylcysteine decarboxylase / phosphopantothenate---cysteine ligase
MRDAVHRCFSDGGGADIYISAAAISDFAPKRYPGKIPSGKKTRLGLEPLPKLLEEVIRDFAPVTVAFKLGDTPVRQSKKMLAKGVAAVLMNSSKTMGCRDGEYTLLSVKGHTPLKGSKDAVAHAFWKEMIALMENHLPDP